MNRCVGAGHFWILCGLMLTVAGCGDGLSLVPVSGTVSLDGNPLPGAEVVFRPQSGRPSMGVTDEEGRYELRYTAEAKGALPGRHTVSISTAGDFASSSDDDLPVNPHELVPPQYNAKTTLEVEVSAKQKEPLDFSLDSKPPTSPTGG